MPLPELFSLREATAADAWPLSLVAQASFLEGLAGQIRGEDILAHCRQRLNQQQFQHYLDSPENHFALAQVREAPVGYAMVCPPDLPVELHPGDLELKRIYVLARFHGTGVAAELMQWAIHRAQQARAPRLLLGVYDQNDRAIAFYRRHGFEICGERTFQVGPGQYHDHVMARPLP